MSRAKLLPANRKVAIITGINLSRNPRARKEAAALQEAGFETVVLGAWPDPSLADEDLQLAKKHGFRFEPVGCLHRGMSLGRIRSNWIRGRRWGGAKLFNTCGIATKYQLGYFVPELFRAALRSRASLNIVHLEQAMWVGNKLLHSGKRVGVDLEDWFSEDLLPKARRERPIGLLRFLEGQILREGKYSSCPSQAMSTALAQEFCCKPPRVIYNAFEWSDRKSLDGKKLDRPESNPPSLHWVSQTIGPGRGLEELCAALPYIRHDLAIHLRGRDLTGFSELLRAQVPMEWRSRIYLHPPVSNEELLSRMAEHDIGFAGEMKYCRNKELTVSNKILHYLLAGLAVVASDTSGQLEVAHKAPDAVFPYRSGDPQDLAAVINTLLGDPRRLYAAKAAALEAAERTFCWEKQIPELIATVEAALAPSHENNFST